MKFGIRRKREAKKNNVSPLLNSRRERLYIRRIKVTNLERGTKSILLCSSMVLLHVACTTYRLLHRIKYICYWKL